MKLPFLLARRVHVLGTLVLAIALARTGPAAADELALSSSQIQALGVSLAELGQPSELAGATYPAKVVLPAQQEHIVSAPVAGVVDRLLVEDNQAVESGQPLLALKSPELGQLALAALEAASKNRLAQQALGREEQLLREGIIAERRVLEAEAAANDAAAALHQSEASLKLAGLDAPAIARLIRSGALEDSLVLRAPIAGTLVGLEVKPGQRVAAADPMLRIADLRRLWLDVQIPAARAASISEQARITVVGRDVVAKAGAVGALVSESQTVNLRAEVTSGAPRLRPGEFVQVQVPFADAAQSWQLPLAAVVRRDDRTYVFVRTAQGFEPRAITVVASAAQSVSVSGPLRAGDQIAVTRLAALKAAWLAAAEGN
jgi:RND family efflux transporter MFP subunit